MTANGTEQNQQTTAGRSEAFFWRKVRPGVRPERCNGCGICGRECPFDAVALEGEKAQIRYERCRGCGICALSCLRRAIFMSLPEAGTEVWKRAT